METIVDFGSYVKIEQKRYGETNEEYLYKVIGRLKSNTYVDVPVQTPETETIHKDVVPVLNCICCGVCEKECFKFRESDVIKR